MCIGTVVKRTVVQDAQQQNQYYLNQATGFKEQTPSFVRQQVL
jgi:hypothetical protein